MSEEPLKVNLCPLNNYSYYLQYNKNINHDRLDFSPGVVNLFGYCRVSTQLQAMYGSSIATQIQLLYDECQRTQYDEYNRKIIYRLARIYVDNGISAKNIDGRPGLVSLQKHIKSLISGRTHQRIGIIVSDLSRLTRSSGDLESIINWITQDSLKLKFIDNSLDPNTNSGALMLKMMASFFEFERKNSQFKTKLVLRSLSEANTLTGHCSYGWTVGVNENGRKTNVIIPEEQEGLNKVIELSRANPNMSPGDIRHLMNKTNILCLRGPGRNFKGVKNSEKNIQRNAKTEWTGKWTTEIVSTIMDHDRFEDRKELVQKNITSHLNQNNHENSFAGNIIKKDEIVIKAIKDHLEETDGYSKEKFNISEIARMIDDKFLFQKKLDRNYVKQMMVTSRIIQNEVTEEKKEEKSKEEDELIVKQIRELINQYDIRGYLRLCEVLLELKIPIIGKRKSWNATNVRDLCLKYKIEIRVR